MVLQKSYREGNKFLFQQQKCHLSSLSISKDGNLFMQNDFLYAIVYYMQQQLDSQVLPKICHSECLTQVAESNFQIFNILFFETTAMILYSYIMLNTFGFHTIAGLLINWITMFGCFTWSARFNGVVLNPAVVLVFVFRKDKKVRMIAGFTYLLAEFVGTTLGTVIAWQITSVPLLAHFDGQLQWYYVGYIFLQQTAGTFLYCMVLMIITSQDITFVEMDLQIWFTMPLIQATASIYTGLPLGINPAFGLLYQLYWCIHHDSFLEMKYIWATTIGPFIGAIIAVYFFEQFYRKVAYTFQSNLKMERQKLQQKKKQMSAAIRNMQNRITQIQMF